jgi:broad specificity phosphatase PhoE
MAIQLSLTNILLTLWISPCVSYVAHLDNKQLSAQHLFMTIHDDTVQVAASYPVVDDDDDGETLTSVAASKEAAFNQISSESVTTILLPSHDTSSKTVVYGIRHGRSVSNDWMRGPNTWGSATYNDAHNTPDAPLSSKGIQQAIDLARKLEKERLLGNHWLDQVELIVVSPLTRCLQTYHWAVHPIIESMPPGKKPLVMAHPLLSERVYTVSETGRPVGQLQTEFPHIDWSSFHVPCGDDSGSSSVFPISKTNHDRWWYDPLIPTPFNTMPDRSVAPWQEWRPHGDGQIYAAAGEPEDVFERRMEALQQWLKARPERHILTVAHWGVYRHLTNGVELRNCDICSVEL